MSITTIHRGLNRPVDDERLSCEAELRRLIADSETATARLKELDESCDNAMRYIRNLRAAMEAARKKVSNA